MLCHRCGRENAAEARFCDACGAALGHYFDSARTALERHGGTVEKFIGDAVKAVFGVPAVQEDDALRAVRAAAELRDEIERLGDSLEREHGVCFVTRIGVNTGEVVVGGDGSAADQRLATGDAVNVAARLEQAAAPGDVLLGAETYPGGARRSRRRGVGARRREGQERAGGGVEARRLGPDVPAFGRPIRTPFVGRRAELDRLRQAFESTVRERACTLATVVGTPGIGKSRLAREFIGAVEREADVVIGRCVAYGQGITYLPLAEIVGGVAGDDPERRLREVMAYVDRGESRPARRDGRRRRRRGASAEEIALAFRAFSRLLPPGGRSSSSSTTSTGRSRPCSTCSSISPGSRAGRRS
jgi:hypothetical protein